MSTEQLRADFEAWAIGMYALHRQDSGEYSSVATYAAWRGYQAGRAALQSQVKNDTTLFCDLKTDEEKSTFFLTGRGYETGVIAQAIQNDVAMAYHRCAEYRKELEALQSQEQEEEHCTWHNDPETDNSWDTSCRQLFEIYDGTPTDNGMRFCCYCGKPIRQAIDHARRVEKERT